MNGKSIVFAAAFLAAIGCTPSGSMNGWLDSQKQASGRAAFRYRTDLSGNSGTITAVLPDGERYSGKFVQITETSAPDALAPLLSGRDLSLSERGALSEPWDPRGGFETFRANELNKVLAVLAGARGRSMRCRFRLYDPQRGLSGGGTGDCGLSTGGTISVLF